MFLESDEHATFEEWTAAVDASLSDPTFRTGMGVVHDIRRMLRVPSPDEARRRVDFLSKRMHETAIPRRAIVVPASRPAQYGMGRLAEAVAETVEAPFRVFKDHLDAAIVWAQGKDPE